MSNDKFTCPVCLVSAEWEFANCFMYFTDAILFLNDKKLQFYVLFSQGFKSTREFEFKSVRKENCFTVLPIRLITTESVTQYGVWTCIIGCYVAIYLCRYVEEGIGPLDRFDTRICLPIYFTHSV